jgi:hypothetical protein
MCFVGPGHGQGWGHPGSTSRVTTGVYGSAMCNDVCEQQDSLKVKLYDYLRSTALPSIDGPRLNVAFG